MTDKTDKLMSLNGMPVSTKTKEKFYIWKDASKRSNAVLFEQLVIHAEQMGFDPMTAKLEWEAQE